MQEISEDLSKKIFKMVKHGYTANDIAEKLCLSISTIYNYTKPYKLLHEELLANGRHLRLFGMRKTER